MWTFSDIARQVYATYRDDKENHIVRVLVQVIVAITIGMFGTSVSALPFTVMSLAISVLTGFGFTALFSEPSTRMVDLPRPQDETDRADIVRLKQMALNFRTRARYFIVLAVSQLLLMIAAVVEIKLSPGVTALLPDGSNSERLADYAEMFRSATYKILIAAIFGLFLEWVYTFYRLTETILAIIKTRSEYIEAAAERE
jgi:hypothetical protein